MMTTKKQETKKGNMRKEKVVCSVREDLNRTVITTSSLEIVNRLSDVSIHIFNSFFDVFLGK
jgi:hypothetical protein